MNVKDICLKDVMKVYNLLADEESRVIFWDALKYSITMDRRYLLDTVIDSYTFNDLYANESNKKIVELLRNILISKEPCDIVVFGASDGAMPIVQFLYEYGFLNGSLKDVDCYYVDNNPDKWGKNFGWYNSEKDMRCYNPEKLRERKKNVYVFVAVRTYSNDLRITRQLQSYGIDEKNIYHSLIGYEYFLGDAYFAEDIMKPIEGDVLCDIGAYDMSNTKKFIQWNPKYGHVYAFEADPVSYNNCVGKIADEKVEVHNLGVWSSKSKIAFESAPCGEYGGSRINEKGELMIDTVALDEMLEGKKVDIIKMDIEGAELEALKGAQNLIKANKPCLTISAYHRPEDIIELPLYAYSLNPDYRFYFRHHVYGIYDTVMYAIDKNR